ncbi:MAG: copper-translocating P-type ATPase [Cytophagales bacterium]|nr:copper-translocating P-type ATPase [Cytophaga sp.]
MKAVFPVTGMSCASCAVSVESVLQHSAGVSAAQVNFANQTVQIEYNTHETNNANLQKAMQSAGYDLIIDSVQNIQDTSDELQQKHIHVLKTQTIAAILLSVPVVLIGMFFMHIPFGNYIMLGFTVPVIFIIGSRFYINAWKQLMHGRANMDTLVAVSTGVAFLFSLFNTFFPEFWTDKGLHRHVYYEASVVVIAFVCLGKWMEEKAKSGTSVAIRKLIGLQPKTAHIIDTTGIETEIALSEIKIGDILIAKPGEKIAVDGIVTEGSSYVDESAITGESIPLYKEKGTPVFAGTINQQGVLRYKAEKVGGNTVVANIIRMVQQAQGSKAPVQKLVDKIAGIFVPVVLVIAMLTFVTWWMIGGVNGVEQGILAAVSVLVVACPCALGLATPTAIMVGIGKGAEHNILIKDAESLQQAHKITAVVLDKTGTITDGKPSVVSCIWKEGFQTAESSAILYALESASAHPLATAIAEYLKESPVSDIPYTQYENIPGKGVKALFNNHLFVAGNIPFIKENNSIISDALQNSVDEAHKKAYTLVYFANPSEVLAVISIADTIKLHSREAITMLKEEGIEVYMLTGDHEATAKSVAAQTGIEQYTAGVLPDEKYEFITQLQSQGKIVAMVGDGINDSQALAKADVSIAMGKGSDIAIDVAKITLLTSDLLAVPKAIQLSKKTVRIIQQNLFWAFIYNVIGIPIAAGVLYSSFNIMLNPMMASAAMALSSVSVVSNSLRLNYWK